jgi:hypothetical protein
MCDRLYVRVSYSDADDDYGVCVLLCVCAIASLRRGPRAARLAGVRLGVGVQCDHRRVEHRVRDEYVLCMHFGRRGAFTRR